MDALTMSGAKESMEMASDMEADLRKILEHAYGLELHKDAWICSTTLGEVIRCCMESHLDARQRYPYSISVIKTISLTTFWLIKLKPLNNVFLVNRETRRLMDFPEINEAVAIYWAVTKLVGAVKRGTLSELISLDEASVNHLSEVLRYYYNGNFYNKVDSKKEVQGTEKVLELIHHFRIKKFTAINIYEVLSHMLLPIRVFHNPVATSKATSCA